MNERITQAVGSGRSEASLWFAAWLVVPLMVAAVVASRWLAISLNGELNSDESQMMAQALRFGIDPVPWRGMDGTTSGPVNSWFLYLAHASGMPMDYRWVHGVAAALHAVMCVLTYATLRQVAPRAAAAAGGVIAAFATVLLQGPDFTHYSSEMVPALIASSALLCIAARLARSRYSLALDCLAGVLLGILPWAKLQAVLGAAALSAWLAWIILHDGDSGTKVALSARLRRLLMFACSTALPGALILGFVIGVGAWRDFWMSYVLGNAAFAGQFDLIGALPRRIGFLLFRSSNLALVGLVLFAAGWQGLGRPGWTSASGAMRRFVVAAALFAVASAFAALIPRWRFPHHEILLLQPLALVAGCVLGIWASGRQSVGSGRVAGILFALCLVGIPLTSIRATILQARETRERRATVDGLPARQIAREIRAIAPAATSMAVWGMEASLHVETGLPPATRHAVSHFLIEQTPAREHLRASFLSDIRREKPDVIVDSVADGLFRWDWDSAQRLQSFPALAEYVRRNYRLASEMTFEDGDHGAGDPVRLYVANEYFERSGPTSFRNSVSRPHP